MYLQQIAKTESWNPNKVKPLLTYNLPRSASNPCDAAGHGDILSWPTLSVSEVTFCIVDSPVSSQY